MRLVKVLSFIFLAGCSHMTILSSVESQLDSKKSITVHSAFWGLLGSHALDNNEDLCPEAHFLSLDLRMSPLDVILTTMTAGIYVRQTVTVQCPSGLLSIKRGSPSSDK